MKHLRRIWAGLAVLAIVGVPAVASASPLFFHFSDLTGDGTSRTDLTGMDFTFDNATGAYTIVMTATAGMPFVDHFRLNVNLFNVDRNPAPPAPNAGFFSDVNNDFTLAVPTTVMTLSGVNSILTNWQLGDRVAINELAFGVPAVYAGSPQFMTAFHTEVLDFLPGTAGGPPWGGEDQVYGGVSTTIQPAVPEPASLLLLGTGLVGLGRAWRKRRG